MNDDFLGEYTEEEIEALKQRFEEMLAGQSNTFFDAEEYLALIEHYLSFSDFDKVILLTQKAYEIYPNNTDVMLRQVQLLAHEEYEEQALRLLSKVEQLDPHNVDVFVLKATIYSHLQFHAQAIAAYQEAIRIESMEMDDDVEEEEKNEDSLYSLIAMEYEKMAQYDEAAEALKRALLNKPDNELPFIDFVRFYEEHFSLEEGVLYMKSLIDENSYFKHAWLALGLLYRSQDKDDLALECFNYMLAIEEDNFTALMQKAATLCKIKNYDGAIAIFHEILIENADNIDVLFSIASCFEANEEYDKALSYYKRIVILNPAILKAWTALAWCYAEQNKEIQGYATLERALLHHPENPEIWFTFGEIENKEGNVQEALAYYKKALDVEPEQLEFAYAYAITLVEANEHTESIHFIQNLILSKPYEPLLYATLAVVFFKSKKMDDAAKAYTQALDMDASTKKFVKEICPEFFEDIDLIHSINEYRA